MNIQQPEQVDRFLTEFNRGDLSGIQNFFSTAFFTYQPQADEPKADEVMLDLLQDLKAAFSDLEASVTDWQVKGRTSISPSLRAIA